MHRMHELYVCMKISAGVANSAMNSVSDSAAGLRLVDVNIQCGFFFHRFEIACVAATNHPRPSSVATRYCTWHRDFRAGRSGQGRLAEEPTGRQ